MPTREELVVASNLAAKRINSSVNSESHWRLAAYRWYKSGYVVPSKLKYRS